MAKKILSILFLIFMLLSPANLLAAELDTEALGIRWGTDIWDVDGLKKMFEKNGVDYYQTKKMKRQEIGAVVIPRVVYGFHADQFFAVYGWLDSLGDFDLLRKKITDTYGEPKTSLLMDQKVYLWKHKKIKIKMKMNEADGRLKLGVYYTPISKRLNELQHEKALERSTRFFPISRDKKPKLLPILEY